MTAPRWPALLLDVDDTLIDTRAAFTAAIDAVARRWLPHLDDAGRAEAVGHWVADRHGSFRAYTRGELTMQEQRRRRVEDLLEAFGGAGLDDEAWAAWEEAYLDEFAAAWRVRPGAVELLDAMAAAGVRVGAVTNASRDLTEQKLHRVGLADRVPILSAVDDRGVGKPDPAMFTTACAALNVAVDECAYVGDELDVDAVGAAAAGLTGIWLDALLPRERADQVWERALDSWGRGTGRLLRVGDLGAVRRWAAGGTHA